MERLLATGDVRDLKGVRICTVGPSTASRLARYGLRIDLTPAEFRGESLVQLFKDCGFRSRGLACCCRGRISRAS